MNFELNHSFDWNDWQTEINIVGLGAKIYRKAFAIRGLSKSQG